MDAGSPLRWGWHELDRKWAEQFVADAAHAGVGVGAGALVLDVGAGQGALTAPLVSTGARVIAVERHPQRARYLRARFGDSIVVVEADASDLRLPRRPFHVVASPPYSITTDLLRRLLQPGSRLVSAHLILQHQAARRWASGAAPGYRRWARSFDVALGRRVPRAAFRPRPDVDNRVLVVTRRRS